MKPSLFPSDVAEALSDNDAKVLSASKAMEFEEVLPVGNSMRTYLTVKFPLRDAYGRPGAVCAMKTDITEKIQAQEQLRQARDELETRVEQRTHELAEANQALYAENQERRKAEEQCAG